MNKFILAALATATLLPTTAMAAPGPDRHAVQAHTLQAHAVQIHPVQAPAVRVNVIVRHDPAPAALRRTAEPGRLTIGARLEPAYFAKSARIAHPARYRLAHAETQQRWVRVRDTAVLVNLHSGRIVAVRAHIFS